MLTFAIARSAALEFALSWMGCGEAIVDLFLPHARMISSFTAMFSGQDVSHMSRFVVAGLPLPEPLSLSYSYHRLGAGRSLAVSPIVVHVSHLACGLYTSYAPPYSPP